MLSLFACLLFMFVHLVSSSKGQSTEDAGLGTTSCSLCLGSYVQKGVLHTDRDPKTEFPEKTQWPGIHASRPKRWFSLGIKTCNLVRLSIPRQRTRSGWLVIYSYCNTGIAIQELSWNSPTGSQTGREEGSNTASVVFQRRSSESLYPGQWAPQSFSDQESWPYGHLCRREW